MPTKTQLAALVDSFDWDTWLGRVKTAVDRGVRVIALDQAGREADKHDLAFNAEDPFVDRHFTGYVGERIKQLDATTRERVLETLRAALADGVGESVTELAGRLVDATQGAEAFSAARALMIARTETAIAYNTGALLAYGQNQIARVEVSDGDGDEECAEADGQIWTVEEAMANPIAHPNCVRSFAPVVDDDTAGEE